MLRQLVPFTFKLSQSRDAYHLEDNRESIGVVSPPNAVVFLPLHNLQLVPRTEDKQCVDIICCGGMTFDHQVIIIRAVQ